MKPPSRHAIEFITLFPDMEGFGLIMTAVDQMRIANREMENWGRSAHSLHQDEVT
jgi:hypothetical protein